MSTAVVIGLGFTNVPSHCVAVARNLSENGTYFCSFSRKTGMSQSGRRAGGRAGRQAGRRRGSHVEAKAVIKRLTHVVVHLQSLKI